MARVVPEPDHAALALEAEFAERGVVFSVPLTDRDEDGLRGFVIQDIDGYGLFMGGAAWLVFAKKSQ